MSQIWGRMAPRAADGVNIYRMIDCGYIDRTCGGLLWGSHRNGLRPKALSTELGGERRA